MFVKSTFYFCKSKWMIVVCAFTWIQCEKKMLLFTWHFRAIKFKWYFLKMVLNFFKSSVITFLKAWHLKHIDFFIVDTLKWKCLSMYSSCFQAVQHIWDVSFIAHTQLSSCCTVPISWWVNSAVLNKGDIKNVPWMWDARNLGLMAPSAGWSSLMNILFLFSLAKWFLSVSESSGEEQTLQGAVVEWSLLYRSTTLQFYGWTLRALQESSHFH